MSLTKNFTQGGQVTLHKLRMIRQVLYVTLTTTLIITVSFFCLKCWQDHTPYQRQLLRSYLEAQVKVSIPFGNINKKTQTFVYQNGATKKVRSKDILKDRWMQQQISVITDKLIQYLLWSVGVFMGSFVLIIGFWVWRGRVKFTKEILSGGQEVSMKDLMKLMRHKNVTSDLKLGDMPLLKDSENKHILMVGTTGAGKSNAFNHLLPQIRDRKQKAIIIDTTGVFVEKYFDPETDVILNPLDDRSKNWSIWKECQTDIQADDVAASLIPQSLYDPFWSDAARSLFVETLKKLKNTQDHSLKTLLEYAVNRPLAKIQQFYAGTPAAALVDIAADKTAASIRVNLSTYIRSLYLLEEHGDPFSIREWITDDTKQGWLFLLAMPDQRETLRPLLTTWLNISINSLMSCSPNSERRIWFIIDEKQSLNKIEALPKALAEIRKYGGCIVSGLQNISQIDKLYGHEIRKTMSSLYNTKIFFRSPDADTAQWIAKTIGENEVIENSEGISFGAHEMRDGVSINEQRRVKAIIPYTEFMSIPDLTAYLKLPEDYPITKVKFTYKDMPNKNVAFQPKLRQVVPVAEEKEGQLQK